MWQIIRKYWVWLLVGLISIGIPITILWLIESTESRTTLIYYTFEIVGGVGTFYAVIIALFNNDLQKLYHSPNIHLDLCPADALGVDSLSQGRQLQVNKYYRNIVVNNTGDVQATDCEIYIDSISVGNHVIQEEVKLKWSGEIERTFIPAGGHRVISFIEVKPPLSYSTSAEAPAQANNNDNRGLLFINGQQISADCYNTDLLVTIAIYSASIAKPIRKSICVRYDGQWSANQAEMERFININ
jgi:hypothetical protein